MIGGMLMRADIGKQARQRDYLERRGDEGGPVREGDGIAARFGKGIPWQNGLTLSGRGKKEGSVLSTWGDLLQM